MISVVGLQVCAAGIGWLSREPLPSHTSCPFDRLTYPLAPAHSFLYLNPLSSFLPPSVITALPEWPGIGVDLGLRDWRGT